MSRNSRIQEGAQTQEGAQAENAAPPAPETTQSAQSAETGDELASPRMVPPLERVENMEDLTTLADRHRVASWQQAALMRHMGWDEGKKVSNADYESALRALKQRRMGGGRKE